MIEGRLQTRSWDAQDGSKRYRTEVVAETLQLGPRSAQSNNDSPPQPQQNNVQQPQNNEPSESEDIPVINEDEGSINPEDIPF